MKQKYIIKMVPFAVKVHQDIYCCTCDFHNKKHHFCIFRYKKLTDFNQKL